MGSNVRVGLDTAFLLDDKCLAALAIPSDYNITESGS